MQLSKQLAPRQDAVQMQSEGQGRSMSPPAFSLEASQPAQMKTGTKTDMPNIKAKRKHIHLTGDDKYGHWWTEMNGSKSYGWWPKNPVGLKDTLFGTEGELNGQTSFGGGPDRDPHHGDSAEEDLSVKCTDPTKSEATVISEMTSFAKAYSGEWRWTFGFGQNCHTFQEAMLKNSSCVAE